MSDKPTPSAAPTHCLVDLPSPIILPLEVAVRVYEMICPHLHRVVANQWSTPPDQKFRKPSEVTLGLSHVTEADLAMMEMNRETS